MVNLKMENFLELEFCVNQMEKLLRANSKIIGLVDGLLNMLKIYIKESGLKI